jgi:hypothetical protein
VAEPDIDIVDQQILHSPLGPNHLFSGVGIVGRRKRTDNATCCALVAFFDVLSAHVLQILNKLQIGLYL